MRTKTFAVHTVTESLAMAAGTMFSQLLKTAVHDHGSEHQLLRADYSTGCSSSSLIKRACGLNAGCKLMLRFRRVYLLCCNGSLEEFESQCFFSIVNYLILPSI